MKKFLTIALLLMLLISCMVLASCGDDEVVDTGIEAKDFEENAYAALTQTMGNATAEFMGADTGLQSTLNSALNKGSVSISFESEDLMGGEITKVGSTTYIDKTGNKLVENATIVYNGEELGVNLFVDKNGVTASGKDLFGSDAAYILNIATFVENIETSVLGSMMGIPGDEAELSELKEQLNQIKSAYEKALSFYLGDTEKLYNELYEIYNLTVTEEQIDGKTMLVVTYTIDEASYKAALTKMMGELEGVEQINIDELLEGVEIDAVSKIYIDKAAEKATKVILDFEYAQKGEEETLESATIKMETVFGDKEISVKCDVTENEETTKAELKLTKAVDGTKSTYTTVVSVAEGSVSVEMLNASFTYDSSNGDLAVSVEANMNEEAKYSFELKGKLTKTDKKVTLEFTSLKMDNKTVSFKAQISLEVLDQIPSAPSDAKDISTLTGEELGALLEGLQSSPLGEIFASMQ